MNHIINKASGEGFSASILKDQKVVKFFSLSYVVSEPSKTLALEV